MKNEIKQNSDFTSRDEELTLNVARTAEVIMTALASALKPAALTVTQYNALRILRGAGENGLMCGEIGERMVTKESDITRLLDRLEARSLITRRRPPENRRAVIATITEEGMELLAGLDSPVTECNGRIGSELTDADKETLINLLETIRRSA